MSVAAAMKCEFVYLVYRENKFIDYVSELSRFSRKW